VGAHKVKLLSCGAGFHSAGIGSKSTGVSKHYWTVFDVPGVHSATSCLRPRLRFLLDSRRVAGMARKVIVQRSSTVGRTDAEAFAHRDAGLGGKELLIVAAHLKARPNEPKSCAQREAQAAVLARVRPIFICTSS
jgi:hypothetical protein